MFRSENTGKTAKSAQKLLNFSSRVFHIPTRQGNRLTRNGLHSAIKGAFLFPKLFTIHIFAPLVATRKRVLISFLPMTAHRSAYTIKFPGLPNGIHTYQFTIDGRFFSNREDSIIHDAAIEAIVNLNKTTTLQLDIQLKGEVVTNCARCLEPVTIPVNVEKHLLVRMVENPNPAEDDDDAMQIATNAHEIDLEKVFYDYLTLEVPYSPLHPDLENGEPGCDPEILKFLQQEEKPKTDKRDEGTWDALKNIKLN